MEGSFDTRSLSDVLEAIHSQRWSGRLRLEEWVHLPDAAQAVQLPLELRIREGELAGGSILDWEGLEAISTFPLHLKQGRYAFTQGVEPSAPLMPFKPLLDEWARMNDQWARFRTLLDSPSRVLETPRPLQPYAIFVGGKSVRAAAKAWKVPLIIAAERAWRGLREGDLSKMRKYAWYGLRIRHPAADRDSRRHSLVSRLDGTRNLGELIQSGVPIEEVRRYLIEEILAGRLNVLGKGWILRDLLWEAEGVVHPRP